MATKAQLFRSQKIILATAADCEALGIKVQFDPDWENAGRPYDFDPQGLVCHHTATKAYSLDYPSWGIVRDGRSDLPGPLAQFGIGRHSGNLIVIAAGNSNHAGPGGWRGLSGNYSVWGIEAENDGIGEAWSPAAMRTYIAVATFLAHHTGFGPEMIAMHREWSPYKPDPNNIDGNWFRAQVATKLTHGFVEDDMFDGKDRAKLDIVGEALTLLFQGFHPDKDFKGGAVGLANTIKQMDAKLSRLSAGGATVDYDLLAKKVADELHRRTAE